MSEEESEPRSGGLHGVAAEALLSAGKVRAIPANTLLCHEGQPTDRLFVLTSGEVEISKMFAGKSHALATSGAGTVLALMSALDGERCPVSVRTRGDAEVIEIPRRSLLALLDPESGEGAELALILTLVAIRRLRGATEELARTLFQALSASPRAGRIDADSLAKIQAGNHAWTCLRLAA